MAINRKITEKAFAKVNLGLDVLRRREDGYHEVKMVMQTIGICDILTFETSDEIEGVTLVSDVEGLPLDDSNLIVKAAKMMIENNKNGCASGRNLGMRHATGELICFIDSDQEVVKNNWLGQAIEILRNHSELGAVGWTGGWLKKDGTEGPIYENIRFKGW